MSGSNSRIPRGNPGNTDNLSSLEIIPLFGIYVIDGWGHDACALILKVNTPSHWQGPGDCARRIAGSIKSTRLWGPTKHPKAGIVAFCLQASDPRHALAFSIFRGLSTMGGSNGSNHPGKLSDLSRSTTCQPESRAFGERELGPEDQTEFLAGIVTNDWRRRRPFATRKIEGPRATRAGFLTNAKSAMASVRYLAGTGPDRTASH